MKLILSPKDNLGKMTLENVQGFALEGETLLVVFENGRTRNYPLQHLWYYESHVDYHKTRPLVDSEPADEPIKVRTAIVEDSEDSEATYDIHSADMPRRFPPAPFRSRGRR